MKANSLESALEKVSRVISDRYGLRLICEGDRCRTDGKTICLPSLPETVPDELLGAIRGWADHECAHAIYTQTRLGPVFQQEHGPEAFTILNALEDARVERLMGRRYPGAKLNLDAGFQFVGDRASRGSAPAPGPFDQFTAALYTRASRKSDQPWISREGYELADQCAQELSELSSCRKTRDVAKVALRIWEKVRELFEQQERPVGAQEPAPPGGQAPEDGREEGEPGESSGPGETGEDPGGSPMPVPAQEPQGPNPMELLGTLIERDLERLCSGERGEYRVYTKEHDVVEVPEPRRGFDYRKEMEELRPYVAGLRRRLLQTLMAKKQTLSLGDQTRGKLDPRALHRLATGLSGRIFRKQVETDAGKTACTLLLDISSSMSGPSIELCCQLALVFTETLDVLGFPTEIIGFSTVDSDVRQQVSAETGISEEELAKRFTRFVPLYHAVYKDFNEPWRKVAARLGGIRTQSLTPLGESLLFAGRRLARRPEERKVLFCLTDGKPVVAAWDEDVTLEHACEAVKKLSHAGIEPVGIGIMEQLVADIFPRHAIIHSLAELPRGFLKQLCQVLGQK